MKRKTTKEFIEQSNQIHGGKYDYSLTNYINNRIKVKIICPIHGIFEQSPREHLKGCGCQKCGVETAKKKLKLSNENFIKKAEKIYNHKYDYGKVNYINNNIKVLIICKKHGKFYTRPDDFLHGHECPQCGKEKQISKRIKPFIKFKQEANFIHHYFYLYFKNTYKNNHTKTKIYCKKCHNVFWQTPLNHIVQKQGCPYCYGNLKKTTKQFIEEAKKVHGERYDYSETIYVNSSTKVKIKCNYCGKYFLQEANSHLQGHGCQNCLISNGELKILNFLKIKEIKYVFQKEFDGLRDKLPLSYDFYLPDYNLLIEYNGGQHYKPLEYFGGYKRFIIQKHHDWLKRKYAKDNNIKLLVISYKEYNNINNILMENI